MQGAGGQGLGLEPHPLGGGRLLRPGAGMVGITGGRRNRGLTQAGLCARGRSAWTQNRPQWRAGNGRTNPEVRWKTHSLK